jgi:hypothetical protein
VYRAPVHSAICLSDHALLLPFRARDKRVDASGAASLACGLGSTTTLFTGFFPSTLHTRLGSCPTTRSDAVCVTFLLVASLDVVASCNELYRRDRSPRGRGHLGGAPGNDSSTWCDRVPVREINVYELE